MHQKGYIIDWCVPNGYEIARQEREKVVKGIIPLVQPEKLGATGPEEWYDKTPPTSRYHSGDQRSNGSKEKEPSELLENAPLQRDITTITNRSYLGNGV